MGMQKLDLRRLDSPSMKGKAFVEKAQNQAHSGTPQMLQGVIKKKRPLERGLKWCTQQVLDI